MVLVGDKVQLQGTVVDIYPSGEVVVKIMLGKPGYPETSIIVLVGAGQVKQIT